MKHHLLTLCALAALAPVAVGQELQDTVGQHEFPGLQLLPAGSKISGISLTRYEQHRVSALLISKLMEIATRSEVYFTGIRANLYAANGETTTVTCPKAEYSFRTSVVQSEEITEIDSERFSASGKGVIFSTANNKGFLKGAVRTTVKNSAFNKETSEK